MKIAKSIIEYGLIILAVILTRTYLFTPVQVNGLSMMNTLHDEDIMILNIIGYRLHNVERFDIVVVNFQDEKLVKRIVGLPGETLKIENNKLYINDKVIDEPFLNENTADYSLLDEGYTTIPEGKYFVLGDNRDNSTDSRYIGFIDQEDILGKANFILFPFKRIGFVK